MMAEVTLRRRRPGDEAMGRRIEIEFLSPPYVAAEPLRRGRPCFIDIDYRLYAAPYKGDDHGKARAHPGEADRDAEPGETARMALLLNPNLMQNLPA